VSPFRVSYVVDGRGRWVGAHGARAHELEEAQGARGRSVEARRGSVGRLVGLDC
jgi:hypothetical protein